MDIALATLVSVATITVIAVLFAQRFRVPEIVIAGVIFPVLILRSRRPRY